MLKYSMGIDFGSNSSRALIVELGSGREIASGVCDYPGGEKGIYLSKENPHVARQKPASYLEAMTKAVKEALEKAASVDGFKADLIVGIGVDTTGSTPLPVTSDVRALADLPEFASNINAYAWMWKDHSSIKEAAEITELASKKYPEYLKRCGKTYSSEWFFAKILHCLRTDKKVFSSAASWLEFCDYIPAVLCGTKELKAVKRSVCAAGHKAMFSASYGGLPSKEFLAELDPELGALRDNLYSDAYTADKTAGTLSAEWSAKLGLKAGIPVAVGTFDAHAGAVGSGVAPGRLVKIIGTSTCDITVSEKGKNVPDIPGICGSVDGSVIPGSWGIEAGQSAVGDILSWYVSKICPGTSFGELTKDAEKLSPGESGLMGLDWENGNRCVLVDQSLTGLLIGMTLHSSKAEAYRALIEATGFGAKKIIDRLEEYGIKTEELIACGGISIKDPLFMQIYADIANRPVKVAASHQTCALGAAIYGAIAAGAYKDCAEAQEKLCRFQERFYMPVPENAAVYEKLYAIYIKLHDAFGVKGAAGDLYSVMKDLLAISSEVKKAKGQSNE